MPDRAESYLEGLRREFPGLRVVRKRDDPLSRAIDVALRVVTFGAQRSFLTSYVTTLGRTIYVPDEWDGRAADDRYVTLRHEAVHLRQFRRLGPVVMALLYLFPILPMGLALGRARLEWEAYRETLRATADVHGVAALDDPALTDRIVRQFTSGAYGWMWPFPGTVRRWIADAKRAIAREIG